MAIASTNNWQRVLGISLRPWSGHSPASLILRGAIHVALCVFFLVLAVRFSGETLTAATAEELGMIRHLGTLAVIALVVLAMIGALRILIGVLDLVPRRTYTGVVISVRERRLGDVLPIFVQRMIFERRGRTLEQRRYRTEVVLETTVGTKQWTLRSYAKARAFRQGSRVRVKVTPLAGYVAEVVPAS